MHVIFYSILILFAVGILLLTNSLVFRDENDLRDFLRRFFQIRIGKIPEFEVMSRLK